MRFDDDGIFGLYSRLYDTRREVELSLEDYLRKCSDDPSFYAGAAERMLKAIGEPAMIDTSQDGRLGRIFMNRTDDENNQDVSILVGKVDIRKLEFFSQNDPDAYYSSGRLDRTTNTVLEFVEMFKAPIKPEVIDLEAAWHPLVRDGPTCHR